MKNLVIMSSLALVLSTSVVFAQAMCGPVDQAIEMVTNDPYNEKLYGVVPAPTVDDPDGQAYIYGNCNTGTYTVFHDAPLQMEEANGGVEGYCMVSYGASGFENSEFCGNI